MVRMQAVGSTWQPSLRGLVRWSSILPSNILSFPGHQLERLIRRRVWECHSSAPPLWSLSSPHIHPFPAPIGGLWRSSSKNSEWTSIFASLWSKRNEQWKTFGMLFYHSCRKCNGSSGPACSCQFKSPTSVNLCLLRHYGLLCDLPVVFWRALNESSSGTSLGTLKMLMLFSFIWSQLSCPNTHSKFFIFLFFDFLKKEKIILIAFLSWTRRPYSCIFNLKQKNI